MRCIDDAESEWAYEEFGHADLGDARLGYRLVKMGAAAAARPGGKVLDVFQSSAERQGAYDFLANDRVRADCMLAAMAKATAARAAEHPFVFVAVDGRRSGVRHLWAPVVANLAVGVSLGLPMFLYMRERASE